MKPYFDDIKAYIDGELSPDERIAFEAALEQDSELRDEVNFMKELTGSIQELGAEETRVTGDPTVVMNQIRGARRPVRWPIALGLAGTFLVMAIGLVSFAGWGPNGMPTPETSVASVAPASPNGMSENSDGAQEESATANAPAKAPAVSAHTRAQGMDDRTAPDGAVASGEPQGLFRGAPPKAGPAPQLIRTANLDILVPSVADALKRTSTIAEGVGGFVTDSSTSDAQNVLATGSATLRVPVKQFSATISRLKELGEVQSESSNSEDVTVQVADVNARLKVLKAEEESYITMLRAARRVGELLEIRERLSNVRQEIESLDARRRALADQTTYSTISLSLSQRVKVGEPKSSPNWSDDAWSRAVNGLQGAGRGLGQAAIFAFVYAPIWLPIVVISAWLMRRKR
jgi:hypothetical protein